MNFKDIFKSDFVDNISAFSALDTAIALGLAFFLGMFILLIYKKTYNGVMFSAGFGVSLMLMTLITTVIILAVTSNVVLSLGMVGALSIVRFRSAIREPLDIAYLFWAIAIGIVLGAGMIFLAVISSAFIGIVMVVFVNRKTYDNPYILVVSCKDEAAEEKVLAALSNSVKKHVIKSKTISVSGIETTYEIRLKEMSSSFVNRIAELEGVGNAVLVSYNGEYMS
jgi:uncharacterized membrane protein YhiD involved in acid resistance